MSDKVNSGLPFTSEDGAENRLWEELGALRSEEPSTELRGKFYAQLEQASRPGMARKLGNLLGIQGNAGWITAAACLLAGLVTGQVLDINTGSSDAQRLASLEQNVTILNRTLILDRLANDSAGKRLQGVLDAAYLADEDSEIADALLQRATRERVHSVRAAAIDVLGRQLGAPSISQRIMDSIAEAESPIVQLALIDLVLRNGSQQQLDELLELAQNGALFPDLAQHVMTSLKRDVA